MENIFQKPDEIKQDIVAIKENSVFRGLNTLSKTLINVAEYQIQSGYFSYAADICSLLLNDDRIYGALENRISEIPGSSITFETESKTAIKDLLSREDYWNILPENTFKQVYSWVLLMGFAVCQVVWKNKDDVREIPTLNFIHPRNIRFDKYLDKWFLRCGKFGEDEIELEFGNGKFVLFSFTDKNPWLNNLWNKLALLYLIKTEALNAWLYTIAHFGNSIQILKPNELAKENSKSKKDIEGLLELLSSADKRVSLQLPPGYDLNLLEPNSKSTWEQFNACLTYVDEGITILILGSATSMSSESGFGNLGQIQRQTNINRIECDSELFSTIIHDQILVPYCLVNYGKANLAPFPKYSVGSDLKLSRESAQLQMKSQGLIPLISAGVITPNEARKLLGFEDLPQT